MNHTVEEEDQKTGEVARNKTETEEEQNAGEGSTNQTGEGGRDEPKPEENGSRRSAKDDGSRQSAEDDGSRQSAEDDGSRQSAEDDGSRQSAEDDGSRQSAEDDGKRQSAEDDGPRQSAEDDGPRQSAEDDGPRQSAEDDGSRQSADDDRPRQSADDDRPRQPADDDRPRQSADDDRPRQSADDDRSRQSADDDRPRQSADDDRLRQSADDDRPRQSADDNRPQQSAENDLSQPPARDYPLQEPSEKFGEGTGDKSVTRDPGESQEQDPQPEVISPIQYSATLYLIEVVKLLWLGFKLFLVELVTFLIGFVSTAFSGHLGPVQLSSAALAIAVFNIAGLSIAIGFAQTCDTLISQTYGGGNLRRVKVLMQRALLFMLLACFLCCAVLLYTEPILLLLNQTSEVASLAQAYVYTLMPAVPEIVFPQIGIGIAAVILNVITHFLFLNSLKLGLLGSALAAVSSHYFLAGFLWIYIRIKKIHGATWSGWSLDCLQEWGPFCVEALCSTAMLCLEFWMFELWVFLASTISELELGAQTVVYNVYITAFLAPLGLSTAASVRVGNALGANNVEKAKLSSKIAVFCGVVMACVLGAFIIILRNEFGKMFTKDAEMIRKAANDIPFFTAIFIFDSIACVMGGVIRGAGKLVIGAAVHFVCYYVIAIPVCLALKRNMGILGIQISIAIGVALLLFAFTVTLCRLDWKVAAKKAQATAGVLIKNEIEMSNLGLSAAAALIDDPGQVATTTVVGDVLSVKQLILRRGLALFCVMVILAVAIIGRFSVMKLHLPVANSTATPFNTTNTTYLQVPF